MGGALIGRLLPFRRAHGGPIGDLSDGALLAACGTGDPAALGVLFDRHATDVYRFLSRLRGADAMDIEDLLQTTFLEAQRAAGGFRGGSAARTWLFGIAANVVRHHARGEVRRRAMLSSRTEIVAPEVETPAAIAERRDLVWRLAQALDDLDHDLRAAFVMCELEEIPGMDAARALGVRPGTLWRRLHDARKALRRALERESP